MFFLPLDSIVQVFFWAIVCSRASNLDSRKHLLDFFTMAVPVRFCWAGFLVWKKGIFIRERLSYFYTLYLTAMHMNVLTPLPLPFNNVIKKSKRFVLFQIPSHHSSSTLFITCYETQVHSGHRVYLVTVSGCIIGAVDLARPSHPRSARSKLLSRFYEERTHLRHHLSDFVFLRPCGIHVLYLCENHLCNRPTESQYSAAEHLHATFRKTQRPSRIESCRNLCCHDAGLHNLLATLLWSSEI